MSRGLEYGVGMVAVGPRLDQRSRPSASDSVDMRVSVADRGEAVAEAVGDIADTPEDAFG